MSHADRRLVAALAGGLIAVAGCSGVRASGTGPEEPSSRLVAVSGVDQQAVLLPARAEERLGVRTSPVRAPTAGQVGTGVVPFASLLYDAEGGTWVFALTGPRTYLRQPVTVETIRGEDVVLSGDGPPVGTPVVTVGVAELFGAEMGVDH
jgi:hypothetical protein